MGPDVHFLRMLIEVRRSDKGPAVIYASRIGYLRKLIEKYKVTRTLDALESKPSPTLPPYSLPAKMMELCYLDDVRADIKFVISFLTMRMHKPTEADDRLADHVLGYLRQTTDLRLRFSPEDLQLQAYVNASYAIHADCRSHHGAFIRLDSSPFHVKSSSIKTVVRSSIEAEIFAANDLASDLLWAIDLMTELGYPQQPVHVFEVNQAVIQLLAVI